MGQLNSIVTSKVQFICIDIASKPFLSYIQNVGSEGDEVFYMFHSQEERKSCGGSSFAEIQYCKLPFGTKINDLISVNEISHWQNDSLYIRDENAFMEEYSNIFDCGIYHNLQTGTVDLYGLNYYDPETIELIIKRVMEKKPTGYEILLEWLKKSERYNGIYIFGI